MNMNACLLQIQDAWKHKRNIQNAMYNNSKKISYKNIGAPLEMVYKFWLQLWGNMHIGYTWQFIW